jgi:hypothetical protein
MKWGWDFNRRDRDGAVEVVASSSRNSDPVVRINLYHALNGKILEIATQHPNKHHDWGVESYIVVEGEKLTDALAMLLIAKGIK